MIKAIIPLPSTDLPLSVRRRIAAQIRAWRGDHSQQDIADACGVSRAQVSNWESQLAQEPSVRHVWILEAFKPGFASACGVRVVPLGTPRRASWGSRPSKRSESEVREMPAPASQYESISLMYAQLSEQVLEHSVSANRNVRLSADTAVAVLQALRAAAAELLDIEYTATTADERSTLVHGVLARLCGVADTTAEALADADTQPTALVTPEESREILNDCLMLCAPVTAAAQPQGASLNVH